MKKTTATRAKMIFVYVLLALICLAALLPFYWLVRSSLMDKKQLFSFPVQFFPDPIRWTNYPEALTAQPFVRYFINTVFLVLANMAGTILTSAMAGYAFSRLKWRGRTAMFYLLITTLMIPSFITLIPTFLVWSKLGLTNTYLPLILPAWFGGGAYNIFLVRQFFMGIPKELDEAAFIDGASPWRVFWSILLPQVKPVLATIAIFTFINVWNDLLGPVIYLNDGAKYTLSVGLSSFKGMFSTRWDYLMAASTVVTLPMIAIFFAFQKHFVEGITMTGIKG